MRNMDGGSESQRTLASMSNEEITGMLQSLFEDQRGINAPKKIQKKQSPRKVAVDADGEDDIFHAFLANGHLGKLGKPGATVFKTYLTEGGRISQEDSEQGAVVSLQDRSALDALGELVMTGDHSDYCRMKVVQRLFPPKVVPERPVFKNRTVDPAGTIDLTVELAKDLVDDLTAIAEGEGFGRKRQNTPLAAERPRRRRISF